MTNKKTKYQRWKEGMNNLTPTQLTHGRVVGHLGGTIGLCLALIVMLLRGVWYFGIFLIFMIWLQIINYISEKQKYKNLVDMMKRLEDENV